ncbi:MAG: CAP domain-containing protein [Coriobacteriia bacterium]|nr:CAP domain-containing protein [Coriobacteriia bacterium]
MSCFKVKYAQRLASLFVASLIVCGVGLLGTASQAHADEVYDVTVEGTYHQSDAYSMLALVNEFRTAKVDHGNGNTPWYKAEDGSYIDVEGLRELKWDSELEEIAMQRAAESAVMAGHDRPNGTSCFTAKSKKGLTSSGENLTSSTISYTHNYIYESASAFKAWREDNDGYKGQGHRRNMLRSDVDSVGIACFEINGGKFWAMELGSYSGSSVASGNDSVNNVSMEIMPSALYSYDIEEAMKNNEDVVLDEIPLTRYCGTAAGQKINYRLSSSSAKNIAWDSTDESVAKVENGSIRSLKAGVATISALDGNIKITVNVKDKDTPEITGFETSKSVKLSEKSFTIAAKCSSGTAPSYSSSDESVAAVSSSGVVTLKKAGTAKITVSFLGTDGYEPASATMTLSVANDSGWVPNGDGSSWTTPDGSTVIVTPGTTTVTKVSAPAKTSISKVSKAKKAFTVKWKKKSGVAGYQVRYSLKSSMKGSKTVTVKSAKATSKKVSKLKKKKRYYVQVRTYKMVSGKTYWSGWSAKKSVKTK